MAKRSNAGGGHGSKNVTRKPVRTGKAAGASRMLPAGTAQAWPTPRQSHHRERLYILRRA